MKKYILVYSFGALVFLILALIIFLSSCRSFKVVAKSEVVHDTVAVHDTVGVAVYDTFRTDKVVHDTVIGESGHEINTKIVHDTVIRNHNVRLAIHDGFVDCYPGH